MAVDQRKACDNVAALSEELGVHRQLLYHWRDQSRHRNRPSPNDSRCLVWCITRIAVGSMRAETTRQHQMIPSMSRPANRMTTPVAKGF